ncbi:MAG: molybdenum cofactor guanylyltransferase [Candidatus Thorarchaeota archaeon]
MKNKYLAFAILIGGKSTRFGTDKGLYKLLGTRLIDYQLDILTTYERDIFLVSNSKSQVQSYIDEIDVRKITAFIVDDYDFNLEKSIRSPMIGLYSAFKELKELNYKQLFVLSCDNPLIKKELIDYLIMLGKKSECIIPQWKNGFTEPLLAIYPIKKAYYMSLECIRKRKFKLTNIIDPKWKVNYISIEKSIRKLDPDLLSFKNVNTINDMLEIKKELNKRLRI